MNQNIYITNDEEIKEDKQIGLMLFIICYKLFLINLNMENYIKIKEAVDDFYYEEFNILKSEIQKDIKVEIINNSEFGDIGGRFNFLKQIIYVNSEQSNENMFLTLLHEYGHFLSM